MKSTGLLLLLAATSSWAQDSSTTPVTAGDSDALLSPWVPCDAVHSFLCDADNKCISNARKCDKKMDCSDHSDEEGCPQEPLVPCQGENLFRCDSGECISAFWKCDDEFDCHDKSDEAHCGPFDRKLHVCKEEERKCATSGLCLPAFWWCDGQIDCVDGSDEDDDTCKGKKACEENFFTCGNGECIPNRWRCDGASDCNDSSDEDVEHCSKHHAVSECDFDAGWFLCADQKSCVNVTLICNEQDDCSDKSDEGPWCQQSCKEHQCEHRCLPSPKGPTCICEPGFNKTHDDRCIDINECATYGRCSHTCINLVGSFNCVCDEGYHLDDKGVCRAFHGSAMLLLALKTEIRGIDLRDETGSYFLVASNTSNSHQAIGLAYDSVEGRVYWSAISKGHEGVLSTMLDGSNKEYLIQDTVQMVEDLAIDYVGRNMYFTDSTKKIIGVASLHTKRWGILISTSVEKPRAIAVYPPEGLLFYTDWGSSPAIIKAGMDGKNIQTVISKDVHWPNGVTVDVVLRRIFWSDAKRNTIESANFDGSDRRLVLDEAKHPFSLAIFEDTIYWSDWQTREILSCNKFTGKHKTVILKERSAVPYGITLAHYLLETNLLGPNPCASHSCSHMCLLAPEQGAWCFCPEGTKRIDSKTCEDIVDYVAPNLLARPNGRSMHSSSNNNKDIINPRIFPLGESNNDQEKTGTSTSATTATATTTPSNEVESSTNDDQGFKSRSDTSRPKSTSARPVDLSASLRLDNEVKKAPTSTEPGSGGSSSQGLAIGIVVVIIIVILSLLAFFYVRNRRNNKAPVALIFRNRDFGHNRMASGSEELKNVQVVRKNSDGTFRNMDNNAASYHDLNSEEFNPSGPGMKQPGTNSNMVSVHEVRLNNVYQSQNEMNTPLGSSPASDESDGIDVFSADRLGDTAQLL